MNPLFTNYYYDVYLYYVRLSNDKRGRFRRLGGRWRRQLKKQLNNCPSVIKQVDEDGYWNPNFTKYVNLYNENCGDKNK